jgi:hypothetical protein
MDILIGLNIISTHPNLKAIYEQFNQIMDNFSVSGSQVDNEDREVESSRAESREMDQHAGQISMIQHQKRHELLQKLVEDESKPETVWRDSVSTERDHLIDIPKVVNLEPKVIVDDVKTTEALERVIYKVVIMNEYDEQDLDVARTFLDNLVIQISANSYHELTPTSEIEHIIRVKSDNPKKQKLRPIPIANRIMIQKIIID